MWFIVSVPVLSELIAEVNPSVSTDGRSLTIAFCFASSTLPRERTTCTTTGRASGMAAIASATAVSNSIVHDCPRYRPSANITIIVSPAAPTIHSVSVFICLVSGVSSFPVEDSMCAIFPTCVSLPVPVTITTPLPCVTGVCTGLNCHVRLLTGSDLASGQGLGVLRGRHALARQRRLIDLQRARGYDPPVRRHLIARRDQHHVADHELLGGDLGFRAITSHPRRCLHHRLQRIHRALGLALLAQPDEGVEERDHGQHDGRTPLLDHQRDNRRPDQDELHVTRVLGEKTADGRRRLLYRERVRAVTAEPLRRLSSRKTRVHHHPELARYFRLAERIPALVSRHRKLASFLHRCHHDSSWRGSRANLLVSPQYANPCSFIAVTTSALEQIGGRGSTCASSAIFDLPAAPPGLPWRQPWRHYLLEEGNPEALPPDHGGSPPRPSAILGSPTPRDRRAAWARSCSSGSGISSPLRG